MSRSLLDGMVRCRAGKSLLNSGAIARGLEVWLNVWHTQTHTQTDRLPRFFCSAEKNFGSGCCAMTLSVLEERSK